MSNPFKRRVVGRGGLIFSPVEGVLATGDGTCLGTGAGALLATGSRLKQLATGDGTALAADDEAVLVFEF